MSATFWFVAGLLAGAGVMLGAMLLGRGLRDAGYRSRKVLLTGGLYVAAAVAVAAGMSLAVDSGRQPASATSATAASATATPVAAIPNAGGPPSPAMPASAPMPSADMMAQVLATPGGGRVPSAEPMDQAAARLAQRLERQGGTAADWNLLAQAYDFLGRPQDAQRARARATAAQAGAPRPAAR
jgi:hypothetical protein